MDASRAYPKPPPNPACHLPRKRPRPSSAARSYHHTPVLALPPPPLPHPLPPPPPPPPPGGSIPKPYDVTPLQFSNDNAHYRDALSKWHYHLIPATPTERWSFTVLWIPMSPPGSDIKLQAMIQFNPDSPGMSCSPVSCPVYYEILGINQILEIYKRHEIPRKIQDMFSTSDRAKADQQALHNGVDALSSYQDTRSGSDRTNFSSTHDTHWTISCILASMDEDFEMWVDFWRQARQRGSEILSARSEYVTASGWPSITTPSTLGN